MLLQLNSERVQVVYITFLNHLVGVNQDQLIQQQLDVSFQQEYPELHEESNFLITLTIAM